LGFSIYNPYSEYYTNQNSMQADTWYRLTFVVKQQIDKGKTLLFMYRDNDLTTTLPLLIP